MAKSHNSMEQQKTIARIMKSQGLTWTSEGFTRCDDLACRLCKKPLGAKDPGFESKPKGRTMRTSFLGDSRG